MSADTSPWPRLAELALVIESYELQTLRAAPVGGMDRATTRIRLLGLGADGDGEDISRFFDEGDAQLAAGPSLPLTGEWTLGGFCEHLATLELWAQAPEWEAARLYRTWAYESAALDLALRQAGRPLHDVLGREARPLRFVTSLGLGDPPSIEALRRRLAHYPGLRLKLDASADWTPELIEQIAAADVVDTIDFKGCYGIEVKDEGALEAMYERVLDAFPDAILEDPHDLPAITERVAPHAARVSYDAPVHCAEDLASTAISPGTVNVKPSRTGGLRALMGLYAHCEAHGLGMYGGGMGELGAGRHQIQLLASIFHPDAPNDVAPTPFNEDDVPAGLPTSPLDPRPAPAGFRRLPS
jgi:L-alanine-DL-glutamate epimerase-like enolase superfamily enzyme